MDIPHIGHVYQPQLREILTFEADTVDLPTLKHLRDVLESRLRKNFLVVRSTLCSVDLEASSNVPPLQPGDKEKKYLRVAVGGLAPGFEGDPGIIFKSECDQWMEALEQRGNRHSPHRAMTRSSR